MRSLLSTRLSYIYILTQGCRHDETDVDGTHEGGSEGHGGGHHARRQVGIYRYSISTVQVTYRPIVPIPTTLAVPIVPAILTAPTIPTTRTALILPTTHTVSDLIIPTIPTVPTLPAVPLTFYRECFSSQVPTYPSPSMRAPSHPDRRPAPRHPPSPFQARWKAVCDV